MIYLLFIAFALLVCLLLAIESVLQMWREAHDEEPWR